jgi:hypothetical protein
VDIEARLKLVESHVRMLLVLVFVLVVFDVFVAWRYVEGFFPQPKQPNQQMRLVAVPDDRFVVAPDASGWLPAFDRAPTSAHRK